jgi:hypothetical protein
MSTPAEELLTETPEDKTTEDSKDPPLPPEDRRFAEIPSGCLILSLHMRNGSVFQVGSYPPGIPNPPRANDVAVVVMYIHDYTPPDEVSVITNEDGTTSEEVEETDSLEEGMYQIICGPAPRSQYAAKGIGAVIEVRKSDVLYATRMMPISGIIQMIQMFPTAMARFAQLGKTVLEAQSRSEDSAQG